MKATKEKEQGLKVAGIHCHEYLWREHGREILEMDEYKWAEDRRWRGSGRALKELIKATFENDI